MDVAVIGSGISGISAVHALVARGLTVTVLDVGETLDERRSSTVRKLAGLPVEYWSDEDRATIRENTTFKKGSLPKKVHFGSDYIYASDRPFAHLKPLVEGRAPFPTFAKGGFSNIWGAAVLPTDACDMTDWPVSAAEMERYYRKVAQLLPICGGEGTLDTSFPPYRSVLGELAPGPQGQMLLEDLKRAEVRLSKLRMLYGKARLAIHTDVVGDSALSCIGCGECFAGCVRGSMFSTIPLLDKLIRDNCVTYQPNTFVDQVHQRGSKVEIGTIDLRSGAKSTLLFDAVFVGAGPINTTRLLLKSGGLYDRPVKLKESQKFVVPLLRRRGARTAVEQPSVTQASAFIEAKVPSISDHWIHLQIVPMNRMIVEGVGFPGLHHAIGQRLWNPILRRVMMAFCGLHSDHSSHLVLCLRRDEGENSDSLELDFLISEHARAVAQRVTHDLFRKCFAFDTMFCFWMTKFSNPGSGTHCGSSFPMKTRPAGTFDSDIYGRPFGWSRVFVVDSSVLPSIPGTTLGFPVMANAYRIASSAPLS